MSRLIRGCCCSLAMVLSGVVQSPASLAGESMVAVGATPGKFAVDEQGGAVYRIPLIVPPGPGGMQPSLALVYSSHGGDGPLGLGWSLQGMSMIHRCAAISPVHGYRGQVAMDGEDPLCINGRFLVSTDASEQPLAARELRTYVESFTRITRDSAGSGFVAQTKEGQRIGYGGQNASRVLSTDGRVFSWLMDRFVDQVGNVMEIDYTEAGNERHIKRIRYGAASVSFEYEPRRNRSVAYLSGVVLPLTQRLTRIVSRVGERLAREYRLTYEDADNVFSDRLAAVTECSTDGSCLRPSVFRWQPVTDPGFSSWGRIAHAGSTTGGQYLHWPGDFNGDGLTDVYEIYGTGDDYDVVWLNQGDGSFVNVPGPRTVVARVADFTNFHFADFNGDGLTDIYQFRYDQAHDVLYLGSLSGEALSFEETDGIDSGTSRLPSASRNCVHRDCLRFSDFNGDGRVDVYRIRHNGKVALTDEVHLSSGDGTYEIVAGIDSAAHHDENRARVQLSRIRQGDFNGDGIADIYYTGDAGIAGDASSRIYLTIGAGEYRRINAPVDYFDSRKGGAEQSLRIRFGDFNADGLSDIYYATPGAQITPDKVYLSHGDGAYTLADAPGFAESSGKRGLQASLLRIRFGDFNADGRTDIYHVGVEGGHGEFYLSTSSGWRRHESNITHSEKTFDDRIIAIEGMHFQDFNGDGATDFYRLEDTKGGRAQIYIASGRGNFIRSFRDGLGAVAHVRYAPLAASSAHVIMADTAPGAIRRPPLLWVVSEVGYGRSGSGASRFTRYRYGEASSDPPGFGFLGFAWKETRDFPRRLVTRESYYRRFPYFGLVAERRVTDDQGQTIMVSTTEYDALYPTGGRTVFPHEVRSESRRYELDGSFVSATTVLSSDYDGYGNVGTLETVTESEQGYFVHLERHEYLNHEERWILGLRTRTQLGWSDGQHADISRVLEFDHDPVTGLLLSERIDPEEPLALARRYEYDAFGNRITESVVPVHGSEAPAVTHHVYDESGRFPVRTINPQGHVTTRVYNEVLGRVLMVTDASGLTTVRRYDGWGRLLRELRPGGVYTTIVRTYGLPGDAPRGSVYKLVRRVSGRPSRREFYDAYGRVLSVRIAGFDGNTRFENQEYDTYGRVVGISLPSVSAEPTDWVRRHYDSLDRLVRESSPLTDGESTERYFNYYGLAAEHIDELGRSKMITRDALGRIVRIVEPAGARMLFEYDPQGRMIRAVDAQGGVTTIEYDAFGNRLRVIHPDQGEQRFAYDAFGRPVSVVDAAGSGQRMVYDRIGRLLERVRDEGVARWSYDTPGYGVGRLASETYNGHTRNFFYDGAGRLSLVEDNRGYVTGMRYVAGQLSELRYPRGLTVRYSYNQHGYLSAASSPFFETDSRPLEPGGAQHREFSQNRLREYGDHAAFYRRWAVWLRRAGVGQALAEVLTEAVEELERGQESLRLEIAGDGQAPTRKYCESILPSRLARAAELLDGARAFDETLSQQVISGEDIERKMHAQMALSERLLDTVDGCTAVMSFPAGPGGGGTEDEVYYWRALAQDTLGRVVEERTGNGWQTRRRYHEGNGYLQEVESDSVLVPRVRHFVYHYDEADNLLSRTDVAGQMVEHFAYDDLDRLVTALMIGGEHDDHGELNFYRYDESGNLVFRSGVGDYEYGDREGTRRAVVEVGDDRHEYDASGNLVSSPRLAARWFSSGKPAFIESSDGNWLEFEYDANGDRLFARSSSGDRRSYFGKYYEEVLKADGTSERFYYIHAGGRLVAVRRDRVKDGRIERKLFYLHQDALGSVDTVSDAAGKAVERFSYAPFGERRGSDGRGMDIASSQLINRGFTGHEYLREVGLVHMNGRIYDPRAARFLSPDPYVPSPLSTQSYNRYSYALNNPMKFTDPSGFFLKKVFKGIRRAVKGITGFVRRNLRTIAVVAAGYYAGAWAANSFVDSAVSKLVWSPGGMWSGSYMSAYSSALTSSAVLGGAVSGGVSGALSGGSLRGVLANAASGGVLARIGVGTSGQWPASRVLSSAAVNGVAAELSGGSFQDAALQSLKWGGLRHAAGRMRQTMVAQSLLNPENAGGISAGLWGDRFKLGGDRYDVSGGPPSPLGGRQSGAGQVFGTAYAPGSLWDRIVEAYAGPHDYFNSFYWYDELGNIDNRLGPAQRKFGEVLNAANVFVATPFATATLSPAHYF